MYCWISFYSPAVIFIGKNPQFLNTYSVCKKSVFIKIEQFLNPYPQTPFPRKGAECGAAALTPLGATPQTPVRHYKKYL